MRCWRYAAPSIMARSIGYSSGIDGAYEKRKNHRMLLMKGLIPAMKLPFWGAQGFR